MNKQRQIVFANRAFMDFLGLKMDVEVLGQKPVEAMGRLDPDFLGRHPGEAAGCIRVFLNSGGCGTTLFCQSCGAVISILNSQNFDRLDIQECRMIRGEPGKNNNASDLPVFQRMVFRSTKPLKKKAR